jgi:tetratricopeptide (TPR) repeat protein
MRPRRSVFIFATLILAVGWVGAASGAKKPEAEDQLSFGVAMAKRGLWNEALFRFRMANQANPNDSRILNNMAVAFEAVGRFEEALASYQRALRADPNSRDLKKNYSRFIEFYQGFKPPAESENEDRSESEVADSIRQP